MSERRVNQKANEKDKEVNCKINFIFIIKSFYQTYIPNEKCSYQN